jgi:hypothetical protein
MIPASLQVVESSDELQVAVRTGEVELLAELTGILGLKQYRRRKLGGIEVEIQLVAAFAIRSERAQRKIVAQAERDVLGHPQPSASFPPGASNATV